MTRVECMRRAAVIEHEARSWGWMDAPRAARARQDRDDVRAAGKALPRRIGMSCARARRRYRKRVQYLGRCHRQGPMPERLRSKRLDAIFDCVLLGHDPVNADDYTGYVYCSRCGASR